MYEWVNLLWTNDNKFKIYYNMNDKLNSLMNMKYEELLYFKNPAQPSFSDEAMHISLVIFLG
jgi:hypothetical protein